MTGAMHPANTAAEPTVARDLADYGATAGDIALSLKHTGCALGNAYEDGVDMPADTLPELRQAHADLAALIIEIEGESR